MPQMRVRGVEEDELCKISQQLIDEVTKTAEVDRKYVKIEYFESKMIRNGTVVKGYPNVDVLWFHRSQELRDKVADTITRVFKEAGYEFVQVTFTEVDASYFFENGEHY